MRVLEQYILGQADDLLHRPRLLRVEAALHLALDRHPVPCLAEHAVGERQVRGDAGSYAHTQPAEHDSD
jgi:hypothetical protein